MERVPCVVVGAGAVGLAVGRALSQAGLYTLVLERNPIFGAENSSRNSEVLHAGLYYAPGSHKARMCEKGRFQLLDYMKQRNVPFSQCGKLVVATSMQEVPVLQKIKSNGEKNGLTDLRMLSEKEAFDLEPTLACKAAMLSPFTGVFDSHTLMLNYVADIEQAGSSVVYNCAVDSVSLCDSSSSSSGTQSRHQPTTAGFEVQTSQGSILCDYLVNAAGMHAPLLAHSMRFYPKAAIPPVYFAKGNYFKLQGVSVKDTPFHRLVYPIPAAGGLGVHATLDMQGAVKFGPNVEWLRYAPAPAAAAAGGRGAPGPAADPADPYRFPEGALPPADFGVNPVTVAAEGAQPEDTLDVFCREIARYWPAVRRDLLVPDYAGIRPKLCGPGPSAKVASAQNAASGAAGTNPAEASSSASRLAPAPTPPQPAVPAYSMPASADFAVLGRAQHGVPGLVCLFGVESPGLTASLAIADHARDLLLQ